MDNVMTKPRGCKPGPQPDFSKAGSTPPHSGGPPLIQLGGSQSAEQFKHFLRAWISKIASGGDASGYYYSMLPGLSWWDFVEPPKPRWLRACKRQKQNMRRKHHEASFTMIHRRRWMKSLYLRYRGTLQDHSALLCSAPSPVCCVVLRDLYCLCVSDAFVRICPYPAIYDTTSADTENIVVTACSRNGRDSKKRKILPAP